MAGRVRRIDRARERSDEVLKRIGAELRAARLSSGRSQRTIARAARISQSQLARIELARNHRVPLATLITLATMLGLKLVVSDYPDGDVIRDGPQTDLLRRARRRLGDDWAWRYEVPVAFDGLRAWDARATHARTRAAVVVEAETRIRDAQSLLRRIALKREAAGDVRVLLVVSDTHSNRGALAAAREQFAAEFPLPMRDALRDLAKGAVPRADAILILPRERS